MTQHGYPIKRERNMARMKKFIEMRSLMNKLFSHVDNSKNEAVRMVELKNATVPVKSPHYKWWGEDRYE
jgi:hypothetical protein